MALNELLSEVRDAPWPRLAGKVGDFALYETLLVGVADAALKNKSFSVPELPAPDDETELFVGNLRSRRDLTLDEEEFLTYFDRLAEIRKVLAKDR